MAKRLITHTPLGNNIYIAHKREYPPRNPITAVAFNCILEKSILYLPELPKIN